MLHVHRMTGVSGSENHLRLLVCELARHGWDADVLIPTPVPARLRSYAADVGAELMPMSGDFSPRLVRELARRVGAYDVAHSHLVHADWHLAAAALRSPTPLVSTKHNHDPFRRRPPIAQVERLTAPRFAAVIAISDSLARFTRTLIGAEPTTIRYGLPAGPEPQRPPPSPVPRLLGVGRLEPQKGWDVLLRALPLIEGARLEIAGAGSLDRELRELAARLGVAERVRFLGERGDVAELMRRADLLVHPARWEGFGLVLLEAMQQALPIVASDVGAIPEVLDAPATGRLVAPEDPEALAAAVNDALADPETLRAMGAAGRRRLQERFTPGEMARRHAQLYESLRTATAR